MVKWGEDPSEGCEAMIDLALPREQAALLAAGMERHCPIGELEEGFALFRDDRVTHAWKDQFNIVHAIVRTGTGDRKLQLDLDFFLASECACGGAANICAHMAAVFFLLFSRHADPAAWLAEMQLEEKRKAAGTPDAEADRPAAPDGVRPNGPSPASAGDELARPNRWQRLIDREMERLCRQLGDRRRIDIFYLNACKKLFSLAESLPESRRPGFRLFTALRIMGHAERRLGERRDRREDPSWVRMVQDLGHMFKEHAARASGALAGRITDPVLAGLVPVLLGQAQAVLPPEGRAHLDWGDIHRHLWSLLFTDGKWRREEADRLDKRIGETDDPALLDELRACLAHLLWLEGRDEAAMAVLAERSRPDPEQLAVYWETLGNAGSWSRFKTWFSFSLPHIVRADGDTFQRALDAAVACRRATGDAEFLQSTLVALLPRSADAYAASLIEAEKYEAWAWFHLLNGTSPDRLDRGQRLFVERHAPHLMFPLYHHAIERLLAAKTRTAYRDIAKLAKRLQQLYRAAGREADFRAFADRLVERNGRQHALMEELQKGTGLAWTHS